jgi:hypothetical protein
MPYVTEPISFFICNLSGDPDTNRLVLSMTKLMHLRIF